MKYIIFSDVQGNYEALRKFFNLIRSDVLGHADKFLCLGDIVQNDTSFDDNLCTDLVRKNGCLAVRGNHEDKVLDQARISRKKISSENLDYLSSLPLEKKVDKKIFLTHAPSGKRIITAEQAGEELAKHNKIGIEINPFCEAEYKAGYEVDYDTESDIECSRECIPEFFLYGHSHQPMLFSRDKKGRVKQEQLPYGTKYLPSGLQYMLNPGGIGLYFDFPQTYMIFDDTTRELNFRKL